MRGSVGCMGKIFTRVAWVTWVIMFAWVAWVKYFFVWAQNLCVSQIFFCVGQLLYVRRDCFTILQLIVWTIFSQGFSQQIFTKNCLTSLVFLSSLVPKVDKDLCNVLDGVLGGIT